MTFVHLADFGVDFLCLPLPMVHFSHDYLNMPLQRGGKVITRLHYIVNLTEARQRYGPGLKGYNTVKSFDDRLSVVEELGSFSCALNLKK